MKVITFKVEEDLLRKLDALAAEFGLSRSELIRNALILYLSKQSESVKKKPSVKIKRVVLT